MAGANPSAKTFGLLTSELPRDCPAMTVNVWMNFIRMQRKLFTIYSLVWSIVVSKTSLPFGRRKFPGALAGAMTRRYLSLQKLA